MQSFLDSTSENVNVAYASGAFRAASARGSQDSLTMLLRTSVSHPNQMRTFQRSTSRAIYLIYIVVNSQVAASSLPMLKIDTTNNV